MEQPSPPQQKQPQEYSENMPNVQNDNHGIQQRIKNSIPLVIRILAYVQLVLSILIFGMEIGIIVCYVRFVSVSLPNINATSYFGPLTAAVKQINEQRMWIINIVTQSISFVFTIILIGITGNYVDTHRGDQSSVCSGDFINLYAEFKYACTKYQLHQAQLAFAILMFFSALLFIGIFLYLYFVVKSFPGSVTLSVYPRNNNNQLGGKQQRSWGPPSLPVNSSNNNNRPSIQQQVSSGPPLSSQLPPGYEIPMTAASDSPLKQIQCPHCHTTLQLPVPKETYTPTQHYYT